MNFNLIWDNLPLLLLGAGVTIKITAISVGLGFLLGLVVSVCRMSGIKLLNAVCVCYVNIIRGTPILVQIFLIYFALPRVIGHQIDPFLAAVAACSINSGAYVSEIFRAGIQSVDKGQMEAGRSLGLSWMQTMIYIIWWPLLSKNLNILWGRPSCPITHLIMKRLWQLLRMLPSFLVRALRLL